MKLTSQSTVDKIITPKRNNIILINTNKITNTENIHAFNVKLYTPQDL